jgi:dienelactone hydrolase
MRAGQAQRRDRRTQQRCAAALGTLAALVSCATPPEPPGPPPVAVYRATLLRGFLHVEVRIPQSPPGRKAVVIGPIGDPERLLAHGVAVARFRNDWAGLEQELGGPPDPPPEPNRVGAWMLAAPRPGIVGRGYFALIGGSARTSVPAVVDWLSSLDGVDPQRIAIAGSSTHGFVVLEALAAEPRLAAGVVRAACGDYPGFLRSSSLALADDPRWLPGGELRLDADYAAELREREPLRLADRFPPRPLLLLAGRADAAIPIACVESTLRAFEDAYARAGVPERLRAVIYAGLAHDLADASAAEVWSWWQRWLSEPLP